MLRRKEGEWQRTKWAPERGNVVSPLWGGAKRRQVCRRASPRRGAFRCQNPLPFFAAEGSCFLRLPTTDCELTYHKNQPLEEIDNEIADIFSSAIYSYIVRENLLRKAETQNENKEAFLIVK
jgi:hypothetical protein